MPNPTGIDLLVPGLLGPIPGLEEIDAVPDAPRVERCLSRADIISIDACDYTTTLFQLFGLTASESGDHPTAPFCRLADGATKDNGYWLQAAPVHLRPDGGGLLLFDAGELDLTLEEAKQLADLIREHFSDRGWWLEVHDPRRWYLRLDVRPDLQTSALTDVIGRNIDHFLPRGKDAMDWHSILNELQMLLHMAKVNLQREGRGQLPINGLWLHGGGSYQSIKQTVYASVSADEPLVRGMSLASGINPGHFPQNSAELCLDTGRHLVVFNQLERSVLNADPYGWIESIERFDKWLEPLLGAIRSRRVAYIDIHPCNSQVYRITAGALRRFQIEQDDSSDHCRYYGTDQTAGMNT
ncbi:MAG: hypothetical protein P8Z39_08815 [Gammaproteobacteria bacterium]